jgi:hypothetical protein
MKNSISKTLLTASIMMFALSGCRMIDDYKAEKQRVLDERTARQKAEEKLQAAMDVALKKPEILILVGSRKSRFKDIIKSAHLFEKVGDSVKANLFWGEAILRVNKKDPYGYDKEYESDNPEFHQLIRSLVRSGRLDFVSKLLPASERGEMDMLKTVTIEINKNTNPGNLKLLCKKLKSNFRFVSEYKGRIKLGVLEFFSGSRGDLSPLFESAEKHAKDLVSPASITAWRVAGFKQGLSLAEGDRTIAAEFAQEYADLFTTDVARDIREAIRKAKSEIAIPLGKRPSNAVSVNLHPAISDSLYDSAYRMIVLFDDQGRPSLKSHFTEKEKEEIKRLIERHSLEEEISDWGIK